MAKSALDLMFEAVRGKVFRDPQSGEFYMLGDDTQSARDMVNEGKVRCYSINNGGDVFRSVDYLLKLIESSDEEMTASVRQTGRARGSSS